MQNLEIFFNLTDPYFTNVSSLLFSFGLYHTFHHCIFHKINIIFHLNHTFSYTYNKKYTIFIWLNNSPQLYLECIRIRNAWVLYCSLENEFVLWKEIDHLCLFGFTCFWHEWHACISNRNDHFKFSWRFKSRILLYVCYVIWMSYICLGLLTFGDSILIFIVIYGWFDLWCSLRNFNTFCYLLQLRYDHKIF